MKEDNNVKINRIFLKLFFKEKILGFPEVIFREKFINNNILDISFNLDVFLILQESDYSGKKRMRIVLKALKVMCKAIEAKSDA